MLKFLFFAILISVAWLVPNYKRFESINKIYANIDNYKPAIFTVTNHHEVHHIRTKNQIDNRYLSGDILVLSTKEIFQNEQFDDDKVYKKGEFKKAYPLGTKINVSFNALEKNFENGQTMRVQKRNMNLSKSEVEAKRIRFAKITFGPLVISLSALFLYILGIIFIKRK